MALTFPRLLQVCALLGPRTAADDAPVEKVKNKAASKAAKAASKVRPGSTFSCEDSSSCFPP